MGMTWISNVVRVERVVSIGVTMSRRGTNALHFSKKTCRQPIDKVVVRIKRDT